MDLDNDKSTILVMGLCQLFLALTQNIFVCPQFSNLFIVILYWQKEVEMMYKGFLAR
jgi:hypothetical protein